MSEVIKKKHPWARKSKKEVKSQYDYVFFDGDISRTNLAKYMGSTRQYLHYLLKHDNLNPEIMIKYIDHKIEVLKRIKRQVLRNWEEEENQLK